MDAINVDIHGYEKPLYKDGSNENHKINLYTRERADLESALHLVDDIQAHSGATSGNFTGGCGLVKGLAHILSDIFAFTLSVSAALLLTAGLENEFQTSFHLSIDFTAPAFAISLFLVPLLGLIFSSFRKGHYSRFKGFWDELGEVWLICIGAFGITIAYLYFVQYSFSRTWLVIVLLFALLLVPVCRYITKKLLAKHSDWMTPVIVIGTGETATAAALAIEEDEYMGFKVVSLVDVKLDSGPQSSTSANTFKVVRDELRLKNRKFPINQSSAWWEEMEFKNKKPYIVLALELEQYASNQDLLDEFLSTRTRLSIVPPLKGIPLNSTEINPIFRHEVLHLRVRNSLNNWRSRFIKRLFDLIGSTLLIVLFSPVFILMYFIVRSDGGAAFYAQERIGRGGQLFRCWKFRSMSENADEILEAVLGSSEELREEYKNTEKLKNDPRVTEVGAFIRKSSIDELPQLFNVLKGEMSLVGPRPVREDELFEKYGNASKHYLCIAPGMSGIWQVSGRNQLEYRTRVKLDTWYVRNWTMWGDVRILFKTVGVVLRGQGAC